MFVRILSLIRLARVSRLVRFFNEVEKVSSNARQSSCLTFEIQSTFLLPADTLPDLAPMTNLTLNAYNVICKTRSEPLLHNQQCVCIDFRILTVCFFSLHIPKHWAQTKEDRTPHTYVDVHLIMKHNIGRNKSW